MKKRILCFFGQTRRLAVVDMPVTVHTATLGKHRVRSSYTFAQVDRSRSWFESFPERHDVMLVTRELSTLIATNSVVKGYEFARRRHEINGDYAIVFRKGLYVEVCNRNRRTLRTADIYDVYYTMCYLCVCVCMKHT